MPTIADNKSLGIQGVLYIGSAGTTATVLYGDETEVSLDVTNDMAGYATRGQPRKNNRCTTQDLGIDFTVLRDFSNTSYAALHSAVMAGTPVAVKALDKSSGYGWDGDFVFSSKDGQPLDGWDTTQFTGKFTSDYRSLTEVT